jgi:hypothetical protein
MLLSQQEMTMSKNSGFELTDAELEAVTGAVDGDPGESFGACVSRCVEASGNTSNKQVEICETKCTPPLPNPPK